jgi:DNA-binding transcriptional LysR family regulator
MASVTLNLRRIQTFAAVAESGSFRKAAEQTHRSPSVVSAHVTQLEAELGVALFHRTTRKVVMTDAGQSLLQRCKAAMSDLDAAVREIQDENQLRRGRVAIGSSPAMAGSWLPPILAEFRRSHPGVVVTLKEDFARDVYVQLALGETHFAIGPRIQGLADLAFRPLLTNPFVVVVAASMAPRAARTMTLAEAMRYPQIALPPQTASRQVVEMLFIQHGSLFSTDYDVKQVQTMFSMVEAGLGVAIMPILSVPRDAHRYRILHLVEPTADQEVCLVTARGTRLSAPAKACSELIATRLASLEASLRSPKRPALRPSR